jgi:hypothetical protein
VLVASIQEFQQKFQQPHYAALAHAVKQQLKSGAKPLTYAWNLERQWSLPTSARHSQLIHYQKLRWVMETGLPVEVPAHSGV